jgi:hypothetical protein
VSRGSGSCSPFTAAPIGSLRMATRRRTVSGSGFPPTSMIAPPQGHHGGSDRPAAPGGRDVACCDPRLCFDSSNRENGYSHGSRHVLAGIRVLSICGLALMLSACRTAPLVDPVNRSLSPSTLSLAEVATAIQVAGKQQGWTLRDEGQGRMTRARDPVAGHDRIFRLTARRVIAAGASTSP